MNCIDAAGNPTPIKMSQKIVAKQMTDALTKAVTGTTLDNVIKNTAKAETEDVKKSKQEGPIDAIAKLMQGPFIIIGIIVIVLAILGFVFKGTIAKVIEKKAGVSFGRRSCYGRPRR